MNVNVHHLYVSPGHNYFGHHGQSPGEHPIIEVQEMECVGGRGVRGDRFFDYKANYKGQITFFALEVHSALCRKLKLPGRTASGYRRNVITEGVDLNTLIDRDFEIQGIHFHGTAECTPCHWMDLAFAPGAEQFLNGRGGLRATILTNGFLHTTR